MRAIWQIVASYILAYRWIWLTLLLTISIFMFWVRGSEVAQHYGVAVPENAAEMKTFLQFKETYGDDATLAFLSIEQKGKDTIDKDLLQPLFLFGEKCKKIEGVVGVISPSHFQELKYDAEKEAFYLKDFLEASPPDSLLARRWDQFASNPFYRPLLLTEKGDRALMVIALDDAQLNSIAKFDIVDEIYALGDSFMASGSFEVAYSGMPVIRVFMMSSIPKDLTMFTAFTLLIAAIILFFFFRSLPLVIIPLLNMAIAILWTLGIVGLLGYKMNLLTGTIPALIGIISMPNFLYLISHYRIEYEKVQDKEASFRKVFGEIGYVMLLTNLTTGIGFVTLAFSDIEVMHEFGVASSLSILGAFIISVISLPISLIYIDPSTRKRSDKWGDALLKGMIRQLSRLVIHHRKWIYGLSLLLVVWALWSSSLIRVEAFLLDDIPDSYTLKQDLHELEKGFGGVMPYEILIDGDRRNTFARWSNLKDLYELGKSLDSLDKASDFRSVTDLLCYARQAFWGGDPSEYDLPSRDELTFIQQALRNTNIDYKGLGLQMTDSSLSQARISGRVYDLGSIQLEALNQEVRKMGEIAFDTGKFNIEITGTTQVFLKGNDYLVDNLILTICIALMIVGIIVGLSFNSYKLWLASVLANLLPLLLVAGIMGLAGIPLKPATCIVFCISFGIAIDDSLHFIIRYQQTRKELGLDPISSVKLSLEETGMGMVLTSVVLFFGFLIFLGSAFGGVILMGLLTALTLFFALFCNLLLLPAILLSLKA